MLKTRGQSGFSLVETMTVVAIVVIILSVAVPNFRVWIANATVRAKAESVLNGLQLGRSEALRRNTKIQFVLTGGTAWKVGCVTVVGDLNADGVQDCPGVIQEKPDEEGGGGTVTVLPLDATTVTFNSVGMVTANSDATSSLTQFDFSAPAATRHPRVLISVGGQARMCDPAVTTAGSADKC